MKLRWANFNESDRETYRVIFAFLNGRLQERATVDWALRLKPNDGISRLALLDLINRPGSEKINEPWQSAWRLIEESWDNPVIEDHALNGVYDAKKRLRTGDRSRSLIKVIVDCVAPKIKVEPFSSLDLDFRKPSRRPKKVEDLFCLSLTSGKMFDPDLLSLNDLNDSSFLVSLVLALDAAVFNGLDIVLRIGWNEARQLHRVYYVHAADLADGYYEPDKFHRGIAPAVKLMHTIIARVIEIDLAKAVKFVHRWKLSDSPVHLRLWASLARDPRVAPASEVEAFLVSLNDKYFWDLYEFPEIAELRAIRFQEFSLQVQMELTARIRKLPPRKFWLPRADANKIKNVRQVWALRELRRIEIGGAILPTRDRHWLQKKIPEFPSVGQMTRLDEGFRSSPKSVYIPAIPDSRYDLLSGEERLRALEGALSSTRSGWDDDPARGAMDWIRQKGNTLKIIDDFESTSDGGATFPKVWERFGWEHSTATGEGGDTEERDLQSESIRVLLLLLKLPKITIQKSINGISQWLSTWETHVVHLSEGPSAWFKIWPVAVMSINRADPGSEPFLLNVIEYSADDHQSTNLDTLNTPVGKLVGVFLAACPKLQENGNPFERNEMLRIMRDTIIVTTERSRLIAMHRLIEELPYFLNADSDWTQQYLITPLSEDSSDAIALWGAIGRRTQFSKVLNIIGDQMADRATDQRLDRNTRNALVFSLVIECLHAFREQRKPAVSHARIQQLIRSLDDEGRAHGAEAIRQFVHDLSVPHEGMPTPPTPEELFQSSAAPFLQQVWPQERSLATSGVSRALAELPATAKGAFSEAVDAIDRFLVPFDCWSLLEYGLFGEQDGQPNLSIIDNPKKAEGLLRLLDLTVGTAEGSVVPDDLGDALEQIRKVAPGLVDNHVFRRLATATRRV